LCAMSLVSLSCAGLVIDAAKSCHYVLLLRHMFRKCAGIAILNAALGCSAGSALAGARAPEDPVACPEGMVCPEGRQTAEDRGDTSPGGPKCQAARRAIAGKGFSEIRNIECSGRYFVFTAWRLETMYIIKVSAGSGRIVSAEPQRLKPLWDQ
ncbi:MAG: hypothetical protein ACREEE_19045, partial [Dongiaceae bacterium]